MDISNNDKLRKYVLSTGLTKKVFASRINGIVTEQKLAEILSKRCNYEISEKLLQIIISNFKTTIQNPVVNSVQRSKIDEFWNYKINPITGWEAPKMIVIVESERQYKRNQKDYEI